MILLEFFSNSLLFWQSSNFSAMEIGQKLPFGSAPGKSVPNDSKNSKSVASDGVRVRPPPPAVGKCPEVYSFRAFFCPVLRFGGCWITCRIRISMVLLSPRTVLALLRRFRSFHAQSGETTFQVQNRSVGMVRFLPEVVLIAPGHRHIPALPPPDVTQHKAAEDQSIFDGFPVFFVFPV